MKVLKFRKRVHEGEIFIFLVTSSVFKGLKFWNIIEEWPMKALRQAISAG